MCIGDTCLRVRRKQGRLLVENVTAANSYCASPMHVPGKYEHMVDL